MALSAFDDTSKPPREDEVAAVLGKTFALWNRLQELISSKYPPLSIEWGCSSKSTGWGLRLKQQDRTVLYMTPCKGYFFASFALGEKAVKAAHESGLPAQVLATIDASKKYAEGTGVRLEVRTATDIRSIEKLAEIKMAK